MRSYSTPESAYRGEVTKVAIVEAFASVALCVSFCILQGSWRYLAVIAVGAPFMLFRTERSADWSLGYWRRWNALLDPVVERMTSAKDSTAVAGLALLFVYLLLTPVVGFVLRVMSTLYWCLRTPLSTLTEAPSSWFRQTLCTDFRHLPELVPMEALRGDVSGIRRYLAFIRRREKISVEIAAYIFLVPLIIGYLIAYAYRVLFKATALAYAPFMLVAPRSQMSLRVRLEGITKGELEKERRRFSRMVFGLAVVKVGFVLGLVDLKSAAERFPTVRTAEYFLVPAGWPPLWQLALLVDAILTLVLFYVADAALRRLNSNHPWSEQAVLDWTSAMSFFRNTVSLLAMAYLFRSAFHLAFPGLARWT